MRPDKNVSMLSGRPHKHTDNVAGAERAPASSGRTVFHYETVVETSWRNEIGFVLNPNLSTESTIRIHNETNFVGRTFPRPSDRTYCVSYQNGNADVLEK